MLTLRSRFSLEDWERGEGPIFDYLPYALLAACSAITWVVGGETRLSRLIDLGLAGLAAVWMLSMVTLYPSARQRRSLMAVFFVGLVGVTGVLVVRAPWFGFFAWSGYLYVFRALHGRWIGVGVAAVAALLAISQDGGLPRLRPGAVAVYIMLVLINLVVAGGMMWFVALSHEQNAKRAQAMAEVLEANTRLEAALQSNAALQTQLVAQSREAGILDERQRMAREIHDTLAQGLTGIITQLQAAEQVAPSAGQWRQHLDAAARLARESLSEARRSMEALRPEPLETARLPEALAEVVQRWSSLTGVASQVTTTGAAAPMSPEIEVTLLRTAQEALANVAKHARATRVGLTLSYMEDLVTLDVRDDGVGFEAAGANGAPANGAPADGSPADGSPADGSPADGAPAKPAPANGSRSVAVEVGDSGGFGLTAMRQRIAGLAGSLEIESEPGAGTAISASLPAIHAASRA